MSRFDEAPDWESIDSVLMPRNATLVSGAPKPAGFPLICAVLVLMMLAFVTASVVSSAEPCTDRAPTTTGRR